MKLGSKHVHDDDDDWEKVKGKAMLSDAIALS